MSWPPLRFSLSDTRPGAGSARIETETRPSRHDATRGILRGVLVGAALWAGLIGAAVHLFA